MQQVHAALLDLRVEYVVLSAPWCLTTERGGCALTEVILDTGHWTLYTVHCTLYTVHSQPTQQVWDREEPELSD